MRLGNLTANESFVILTALLVPFVCYLTMTEVVTVGVDHDEANPQKVVTVRDLFQSLFLAAAY